MGCLSEILLNAVIQDVSSSGQVYVVAPVAGTVTTVYSVLGGAITLGDATLTVKDGDGNEMGDITIANSSSAAGDKDSLTPTANNVVAAAEVIEIETDGGSTDAQQVDVTVVLTAA